MTIDGEWQESSADGQQWKRDFGLTYTRTTGTGTGTGTVA